MEYSDNAISEISNELDSATKDVVTATAQLDAAKLRRGFVAAD